MPPLGVTLPPVLVRKSGKARSERAPPTEGKDDMARRSAIVIGVAGVMALGVALLASPASAVTEYHFTLFEKASFHDLTNKKFRFKGGLFDPQNRDNRVGSDHGQCKAKRPFELLTPRDALKCRGTAHLDGDIGGFGDIEYRGHIRARPPDSTLNVVGGSDDFAGATGTYEFRSLNRSGTKTMNEYDLVVP
jgi:hypothetical protein